MKVAVSIPDPVFAEAEELVRQLETSRSELYARALAAFIAAHTPNSITAAIDAVIDSIDPQSDDIAARAARQVLERVEW